MRTLIDRSRDRGAALVEFQLVALLALLPMLLGIVQIALLMASFHLLSFAAAEAARAGAVGHAQDDAMAGALASGLVGLHANLAELGTGAAGVAQIALARARSEADVRAFGTIERLRPTAGDFQDFSRDRDGRSGIPNDSLEYRSSAPGPRSGHSLQEANWLHIRVSYCQALVVPLIDRLLPRILQRLDGVGEHARCYAAGRVPLTVWSSAPMQSEARP